MQPFTAPGKRHTHKKKDWKAVANKARHGNEIPESVSEQWITQFGIKRCL